MPSCGLLPGRALLALLIVLAICNTRITLADQEASSSSACPAWLDEYAQFHRANRGSPDAKYIIYHCGQDTHCNGIGDRMKSILMLLRVAAVYNKVLLVNWNYPAHAAVERFLEPNRIDWRLSTLEGGGDLLDRTKTDLGWNRFSKNDMELRRILGLKAVLKDGDPDAAAEFMQLKVLRTNLLQEPEWLFHGNTDKKWIHDYGELAFTRCLFNFLFRPSELLLSETQRALGRVYGANARPYMAWHWRTGGQVNELKLGRTGTTHDMGSSRLRQIISVVHCAQRLAAGHGMDPPTADKPILMVTDNNLIRQFVVAGELSSLTTTNATSAHIRSGGKYQVAEEHAITTFVDLRMLAEADCLLYSHSGYSKVALWMSSTTCHHHLHECLVEDKERFRGVEVRKLLRLRRRAS